MPYTSDRPEEFGQMGSSLSAITSNHEEVEFKQDHSKVQEFIGQQSPFLLFWIICLLGVTCLIWH